MERIDRAEARGDGVIGEEQERADDAEQTAALLGGGVDAAAVRVDAADLRVRPADREDQQAHAGDQPEAASPSDEERQTEHVEAAGPPVPEQQRRGLKPVDVPRALAVQQRERRWER